MNSKVCVKKILITCFIILTMAVGLIFASAFDTAQSRSFLVESVSGTDATLTKGTRREFPVRSGTRLGAGNTITTGRDTTIVIKLDDNSTITMAASSKIDVSQLSRTELMVTVVTGSIAVDAKEMPQESRTRFRAGNTTMGVRGTLFTIGNSTGHWNVVLLEGVLAVSNPSGEFDLEYGHLLEILGVTEIEEDGSVNIIPLDVTKISDSFTLGLLNENSEMLIGLGVITEDDAAQLDTLITEALAEEEQRAQEIEQAQQEQQDMVDEQQRTIIYLGDGTGLVAEPIARPLGPLAPMRPAPIPIYTVTFVDDNGTVLKTESVVSGGNATPPADPIRNEWRFDGWSGEFTNITSNRTLTATYQLGFLIQTVADLSKIGTGRDGWTLNSNYTLMNNIAIPNYSTFSPIGWAGVGGRYTGTFNGNGYTIAFNDTMRTVHALIGENYGTVRNLTVTGSITGIGAAGGIALDNYGRIENCTVSADISADNYVGGVAGRNYGTIINCTVSGSVSATGNPGNYVGGIAGDNERGRIERCTLSAGTNVTGSLYVGGIAGRSQGTSSSGSVITGCISRGNVTGEDWVGGIVGFNSYFSTISNTNSHGNITGTASGTMNQDNESGVGGVAGFNTAGNAITNSFATGAITGVNNVGGVVGSNFSPITGCYYNTTTNSVSGSGINIGGVVGLTRASITNCFSTGNVTGTGANSNNVGGVAGQSEDGVSFILGSYSMGTIRGVDNVGGVVGLAYANVGQDMTILRSACYARGDVYGNDNVGGLVGWMNYTAEMRGCYYENGTVTGTGINVGGIVGSNGGGILDCEARNLSVVGGPASSAATNVGRIVGINRIEVPPRAYLAGNWANTLMTVNGTPIADDGSNLEADPGGRHGAGRTFP